MTLMLSVHTALLEHCLKLLKMPKWDKTVPNIRSRASLS